MGERVSEVKRIAIAAGGTGGHIFPAITTAKAILKKSPETEIKFFCSRREIELEIYKKNNIQPEVLPIGRYGYGLLGKIKLAAQLIKANLQSKKVLKDFNPNCILGMGGYMTYPTIRAANSLKIPIVLHEQNSVLGRAHQMSVKWADQVACSYKSTQTDIPENKSVFTGLPIREEFYNANREEGRQFFKIPDNAKCILITGGSQGAQKINLTVNGSLSELDNWLKETDETLHIIWSGVSATNFEINLNDISDRIKVQIFPFIEEMHFAYAAADLVFCRSGASSVAESIITETPAIYLPLPYAPENHQYVNAEQMRQKGTAEIIVEEDKDNVNMMSEQFTTHIKEILFFNDGNKQKEMRENTRKVSVDNAADQLADILLGY